MRGVFVLVNGLFGPLEALSRRRAAGVPLPSEVAAQRSASDGGGAPGEVTVTPHNPASFGRSSIPGHFAALPDSPFFVDWLSIKQTHYNRDLPYIQSGTVMSVSKDGELEWKTSKAEKVEGSHETSLRLRCDGHTVSLSGNVSGFGRTDNVFGLGLAAAVRKASQIVGRFGLPPFTAGQEMPTFRKRNTGEVFAVPEYNGARITRLDLTANYATGSAQNAHLYMAWLATQQHSRRIKVGTYDSETVDWGRGSRRLYAKAYIKAEQLRRMKKAPDEVIEFCDQQGMVRFELTAKATQLQSMGCHTLGDLHMGRLIELFEGKQAVMSRATLDVDDLDELPRALRCTARDYLAGDDLVSALSERTFRRHRAGLLPYGIDIAVKSNVSQFRPKVKVIELRPIEVPDWYQLEDGRFAA